MRPTSWVHRGHVMADGARVDRKIRGEQVARQRVVAAWERGDRLYVSKSAYVLLFAEPRRLASEGPIEPLSVGALATFPDAEPSTGGVIRRCVGGNPVDEPLTALNVVDWFAGPPMLEGRALPAPPCLARGLVVPGVGRASFGVGELDPTSERLVDELRAGRSSAGSPTGGAAGPPLPIEPPRPAAPSAWSSLVRGVSAFFGRAVSNTPLDRVLQTQHERMLSDVLERFTGDLDEALRRAIPLGKGGVESTSHPALRAPAPRSSLRPNAPSGTGGGGTFRASATLFDALRETYEATAVRLEAEGDIEKAAFIWSNLLGDVDRAIEVLELHGHFDLAARLALENHRADQAVRLRLRAGDVSGAIAIAHRNQCFAEAVRRLDDDEARSLRAAWAAHLLSLGRLDAAIDVVWADPTLRIAAAPWLAVASKRDGRAGAVALARWAEVDRRRAEVAFETRSFGVEGAIALLQQKLPDSWRRPLARKVLGMADQSGFDRAAVLQGLSHPMLVDLRVEVPVLHPCAPVTRFDIGPEVGGPWPVHDAAPVAIGWVIAHGESGGQVLDVRGGLLLALDEPVHHVVVELGGFAALLLASLGGERYRLSRLDLRTLTVTPWTRVELSAWASSTQNGRWAVAFEGRLHTMDLASSDWDWLYQGLPLEGRVLAIHDGTVGCSVVLDTVDRIERYDRRFVRSSTQDFVARELFAVDGQATLSWDGDTLLWRYIHRTRVLPSEPLLVAVEVWGTDRVVLARLSTRGVRVVVEDAQGGELTVVELNDVDHVVLRRRGDRVVVHDRTGRVVELLRTGEARAIVSR